MQVSPNSTIKLYSGVPLDNTYTDTIRFQSLISQNSYFHGQLQPVKTFTYNTYQRVNNRTFEAQCLADEIYNCNYMAFQNTAYGNKWFYAFINSIEYVNNGNSRVTFEIDVIQTYFLDCTLEQCFVEREHSVTDAVGDNIIPEPILPTEYVFENYGKIDRYGNFDSGQWDIVVGIADTGSQTVDGKVVYRVYSGVDYKAYRFNTSGVSAINGVLQQYIQQPDSIVNMYMTPHWVTAGSDSGRPIGGSYELAQFVTAVMTGQGASQQTTIGNYTPKNKKMFVYPYNYLHADDGNGGSLALRYEFFNDGIPKFKIYSAPLSPVQIVMKPYGYKGSSDSAISPPLMTEFLTIASYPLCSWNFDTYKAWIAQNAVPEIINSVAGAAKVVGGAVGGIPSIGISGAGDLMSVGTDWYSASIQADTVRGNISCGNANIYNDYATFFVGRCMCNEQEAEIIDNYFTVYGYACKKVKVPNIESRPRWNYVRTRGCKIIGNCPTDDIKKICDIFDKGITWWRYTNDMEVGNYSGDNAPQV